MSFTINEAFVEQYNSLVTHLSQQKGSRLRGSVEVDSGVVGRRAYYNQVGKVVAQSPTSRHSDTPLISTPHSTRVVDMIDKEWADLIDNDDLVRTLIEPTNPYVRTGAFALGRAIDEEIIRAFTATSVTGKQGDSLEGFDTTNQQFTAAGATVVAVADLITARGKLSAAEAFEDGEPLFCVCSRKTIDDLLADSDVKTIDSNTYRALAGGELTDFMGFTFIQTELVDGLGSATESAYFYPMSGVTLGIGADITHSIDRRPDKRNSMQVYSHMTIGATRMENVKIVEMLVDHT